MPRAVGCRILVLFSADGRGYPGGMTRQAAYRLARLLTRQGFKVRVSRHAPFRGCSWCCFYTVEDVRILFSTGAMVPGHGELR